MKRVSVNLAVMTSFVATAAAAAGHNNNFNNEGRTVNLTTSSTPSFLDDYAFRIAVNSTSLGNKAGILLASTFLTAAVWTNLPQELKDNIFSTFSSSSSAAQSRVDQEPSQSEQPATYQCDCDAYCYDTYLNNYYSSNVNGFESRRRKRG